MGKEFITDNDYIIQTLASLLEGLKAGDDDAPLKVDSHVVDTAGIKEFLDMFPYVKIDVCLRIYESFWLWVFAQSVVLKGPEEARCRR
jgi:hypothetical protein